VDLDLGKLLLVEAPSELEGGSKVANIERVKGRVEDFSPGVLVAGDTTGSSLLMKAAGEFFTIHAPVESAMSALSKGVDVAFCGTRGSIERMLEAVQELKKASGYEIKCTAVKG